MVPIPAGLQPGAQTAQWVLDQITTFPETWNQAHWEWENACGTTYCVAGWAATVHGQEFLDRFNGGCGNENCNCSGGLDWLAAGMAALQIDLWDVDKLFSGAARQEDVLRWLKRLANGEPMYQDFD